MKVTVTVYKDGEKRSFDTETFRASDYEELETIKVEVPDFIEEKYEQIMDEEGYDL